MTMFTGSSVRKKKKRVTWKLDDSIKASQVDLDDEVSTSSSDDSDDHTLEDENEIAVAVVEEEKSNEEDVVEVVKALVDMQNDIALSTSSMVTDLARTVDEQQSEIQSLKSSRMGRMSSSSSISIGSDEDRTTTKKSDHCGLLLSGIAIKQAVFEENVLTIVQDLRRQLKEKEKEAEKLNDKVQFLKDTLTRTRKDYDREVRCLRSKLGEQQQQQSDATTPRKALQRRTGTTPSPSILKNKDVLSPHEMAAFLNKTKKSKQPQSREEVDQERVFI